MCLSRLTWDSEFFKMNVYKVEEITSIEELESKWNKVKNEIDLAYYESELNDSNYINLQELGFRYILSKTVLENQNFSGEYSEFVRVLDINENLSEVKDIGKQLSKYSRFYKDINFDRNIAGKMYDIWIEKAIKEPMKTKLFVNDKDGINGFLLISIMDESTINIELIASKPDKSRKGVGSMMIKHAFEFYRNLGFSRCVVVTQGDNINAIRFYNKMGFDLVDSKAVFHYWNKDWRNA